ncbi:MAG: GIY-YIG nuclease family protein [Patescibacteria group bacterium]|jgi:putative endonuclease|nr:GIY-YIG nuclease family protein [Patescibacteria group bacterium]MDD5173114.1 GIY-YIG nuclease family protein [Patescibacteria group bacterium]
MFYVYILKSLKDNNLYIGKTNDLQRRLNEHNGKHVQSTKSRIPFIILKYFKCRSEKEALELEKEFKKGYKREKIKRKYNI